MSIILTIFLFFLNVGLTFVNYKKEDYRLAIFSAFTAGVFCCAILLIVIMK
jgi:hypothetical protein